VSIPLLEGAFCMVFESSKQLTVHVDKEKAAKIVEEFSGRHASIKIYELVAFAYERGRTDLLYELSSVIIQSISDAIKGD
jgi:hypothetical protein